MSGKEAIPFTVIGPIPVHLPESNMDRCRRTGCAIIDLDFQHPCQVGELVLSNYYSSWMSVYVKRTISNPFPTKEKEICQWTNNHHIRPQLGRSFSIDLLSSEPCARGRSSNIAADKFDTVPSLYESSIVSAMPKRLNSAPLTLEPMNRNWEFSVHMKHLMPWSHFESGSQDIFSIPATESMVEWRDVVVMRLVIHQPSTVWKRFSIEDVNVYRQLPKRGFSHCDDLVRQRDNWFTVLRKNTQAMLSGQVVEPENCETDEGAT